MDDYLSLPLPGRASAVADLKTARKSGKCLPAASSEGHFLLFPKQGGSGLL